jgi:hypothetical protein
MWNDPQILIRSQAFQSKHPGAIATVSFSRPQVDVSRRAISQANTLPRPDGLLSALITIISVVLFNDCKRPRARGMSKISLPGWTGLKRGGVRTVKHNAFPHVPPVDSLHASATHSYATRQASHGCACSSFPGHLHSRSRTKLASTSTSRRKLQQSRLPV